MDEEKPRRVKAKITRIVTEIAIVALDRDGNIDEHFETIEELDFECDEVINIESVLSTYD
jgi:hypothetical protein